MKLLLVTSSYPAHEDDPSGHFVRSEARALARRGHEVHVVAPLHSPFDPPEPDPLAPSLLVHRAGGGSLFGWPGAASRAQTNPLRLLQTVPFAVAVRALVDRIGPVDRAIAHWIVPSAVPLLLAHRAPLEVVAHGADVRLLCALPSSIREAIVGHLVARSVTWRFAARASLDLLARSLSSHLEAQLRDAARVEPAAIDLPDVSTRARELSHAYERGFVVTVGRLVELKRIDMAIEAAAAARVALVIVGDGPARSQLEHLARSLGAQVTFAGLVSRRDALAWIAASRALVHCSVAEAAPTVVREARSLGVPVVATPSGDVLDWSANDPGITVVDPGPEQLAMAIHAAIAGQNPNDRLNAADKFP